MDSTAASSFASSNSTPWTQKFQIKNNPEQKQCITLKYSAIWIRVYLNNRHTSIFSFLATESQSFVAIPIFQSRFRDTPDPFSALSSQKQAR